MALNIKDKTTEDAVRALAALTDETVTQAERRAAEQRLRHVRRRHHRRPGGSIA